MSLDRATWLCLLLVFVVVLGAGARQRHHEALESNLSQLLRERASTRTQLARADAKRLDLERLILELDAERAQLVIDLAAALERPAQVRTITHVETVLEAGPVVDMPIAGDCPAPADTAHNYTTGGLTVARYEQRDAQQRHITYDLAVRATVAIGDVDAVALVEVATGADPEEWVEVPAALEVHTATATPHKLVSASVALGVSGHLASPLPAMRPQLEASAALLLPWLHPSRVVDVMTPRLGVSSRDIRAGVDVVSWNLGAVLPVVDDLWIGAGASIATDARWSADLTVSTRL
jgi:hypothetical protein